LHIAAFGDIPGEAHRLPTHGSFSFSLAVAALQLSSRGRDLQLKKEAATPKPGAAGVLLGY
jgi:hypothetical protein